MALPLLIIGAGGHGRELVGIVDDLAASRSDKPWDILGFIDDGAPDQEMLRRLELPHLGGTNELPRYGGTHFVIGIGDGCVRRRLHAAASDAGMQPATLIHPLATIGRDVRVGPGVVICAHASVTTNIDLGCQVHINRHAAVGHDTIVHDHVTLHPASTISGNVILCQGVTVGANATIIPGCEIGEHTVVGAGAVVTRDIAAFVTAVGVPARPRPGGSPNRERCRHIEVPRNSGIVA